jgi:REP element-mobilizing transposase RayT
MIRGIEGRRIFHGEDDREHFLFRVRTLVKETQTRILAWAILDNHVHMLLFSGREGISTFMRRLLTGYAVWFNRKHRRSGHLFQNRFKSIVCEEDPYLLELVRYIHLNPLRAKVVKSMEELNRYPWSGHSVLVEKHPNDWQEKEYVLQQFSTDRKEAIRVYQDFLAEGKDWGRRPELVGGGLIRSLGGWSKVLSLGNKRGEIQYDARILGSGDFVQTMLQEAEEKIARQMRYQAGKSSTAAVIKEMCKEGGVNEEELLRGGRRRKVSEVRAKIACHLTREMGLPLAEIARNSGVGTSAIAMAIRKKEKAREK